MNHYVSQDGKGFFHQPSKRETASLSSTATCVTSLVRAGLWKSPDRTWGSAEAISTRLLKRPWKSAGLSRNNPFGLSFIAEGVLDVSSAEDYPSKAKHLKVVYKKILPLLHDHLMSETSRFAVPGSVGIDPYPPSAYLTHIVFRVLKRCEANAPIPADVATAVEAWTISEIHRQIALIATASRIADPLQLGYAIVLSLAASADEEKSPEDKALISAALKLFFDQQGDDGTWKLSQPLFHYPDVGNAHCFDYELLTQLISCEPLQEELIPYLHRLERSVEHLNATSFDLGMKKGGLAMGWASGHHPQIAGPESWSTACAYDFVHALDRLVAEATRRALFREVGGVYAPPQRRINPNKLVFAEGFLDAPLTAGTSTLSLVETLRDRFVLPIGGEAKLISNGGRLSEKTPMSAMLFGPPGTSKTELAKHIAIFLGWPLLSVDPSYLIEDGIDHLHTRANKLFQMLEMAEEVVVLLDEFDEMGRNRAGNNDMLSRFITTSMLPKLAAINKERRIVFLLATNFVEDFDSAFSRGGRFDMIVQIMPPTIDAKLDAGKWSPHLRAAFETIHEKMLTTARAYLSDLTFLETNQLALRAENTSADFYDELVLAHEACTLERTEENEKTGENEKWKDICIRQRGSIRLPASN